MSGSGALGRASGELAHFGFAADRKPARPLTVEEKALRAARARATRAARGTMGPRQRARIKGDLASITLVAPATAPEAASKLREPPRQFPEKAQPDVPVPHKNPPADDRSAGTERASPG